MNVIKGSALVLSVVLTGALVTASSPDSSSGVTTTPAIRLKTISSRVTSKGTSLVIEATEPVPYVATRPDPLTLLIDFRNVAADTVTSTIADDVEERDRVGGRRERRGRCRRRCGAGDEPARPHQAGRAGRVPRARQPEYGRHRVRQGGQGRQEAEQDPAVRAASGDAGGCRRRRTGRPADAGGLDRGRSYRGARARRPDAGCPPRQRLRLRPRPLRPPPRRRRSRPRHRSRCCPAWPAATSAGSPAIPSASTSRAPISARCCAPSPRSAASTS